MLLDMVATELGLDVPYLKRLVLTADYHYRAYEIPKKTGGTRTIEHPSQELKALQRWLLRRVLEDLPVHSAVMSYRHKINIAENAGRHVNSRFLLRMDFRDFFPSLTADDVRSHFLWIRDCSGLDPLKSLSDDDLDVICKIVCRRGHLTIGAVTSPALSNTLCWHLDSALRSFCDPMKVSYSRYADDLVFSSDRPQTLERAEERVRAVLKEIPYPKRLTVNEKKVVHLSKRRRRVVSGLVLTCEGQVSVGRKTKRRLRALVHQLEHLDVRERSSLAGFLAFVRGVEPELINRLAVKYGPERLAAALSGDEGILPPKSPVEESE